MNEETERAFWRWYNMSQQATPADIAKGIFNAGFNACATLDLSLEHTDKDKQHALRITELKAELGTYRQLLQDINTIVKCNDICSCKPPHCKHEDNCALYGEGDTPD